MQILSVLRDLGFALNSRQKVLPKPSSLSLLRHRFEPKPINIQFLLEIRIKTALQTRRLGGEYMQTILLFAETILYTGRSPSKTHISCFRVRVRQGVGLGLLHTQRVGSFAPIIEIVWLECFSSSSPLSAIVSSGKEGTIFYFFGSRGIMSKWTKQIYRQKDGPHNFQRKDLLDNEVTPGRLLPSNFHSTPAGKFELRLQTECTPGPYAIGTSVESDFLNMNRPVSSRGTCHQSSAAF
ncbi:hypothetical protein AVEN_72322-1 [Araneus ventricosus]|uniref:Uncharacterized protein n=1 Tax=Araneus ventricosus TaxID=182803 RepID=A0A4Y2TWG5_ARAVE|nr:hypothetical protein AVEN_72322-1 [Araneus ventricosus]